MIRMKRRKVQRKVLKKQAKLLTRTVKKKLASSEGTTETKQELLATPEEPESRDIQDVHITREITQDARITRDVLITRDIPERRAITVTILERLMITATITQGAQMIKLTTPELRTTTLDTEIIREERMALTTTTMITLLPQVTSELLKNKFIKATVPCPGL